MLENDQKTYSVARKYIKALFSDQNLYNKSTKSTSPAKITNNHHQILLGDHQVPPTLLKNPKNHDILTIVFKKVLKLFSHWDALILYFSTKQLWFSSRRRWDKDSLRIDHNFDSRSARHKLWNSVQLSQMISDRQKLEVGLGEITTMQKLEDLAGLVLHNAQIQTQEEPQLWETRSKAKLSF